MTTNPTCLHPGCSTTLTWRGTGRPPRFCRDHQGAAAAKARQRERDAQPAEHRPPCCTDAGRRGGRKACEQHHTPHDLSGMPEALHPDDFAGAAPNLKHRGSDYELPPAGSWRVAGNAGTDALMLNKQSMTERYTHNGAFIRVIGQPDLTANWRPIPGKPAPAALVSRGPAWPWRSCAGGPMFEFAKGVAA